MSPKNAIEFLRRELEVPDDLAISVEFVNHDMKQFEVYDIVTGTTGVVKMLEFHNGVLGTRFWAGYHEGNQRLYIRDEFLAPDGADGVSEHTIDN